MPNFVAACSSIASYPRFSTFNYYFSFLFVSGKVLTSYLFFKY